MLPEELDVKAVMDGTGLSRRTVGRYLADGTLAGYKSNGQWRITRTALDEAISAGRIQWRDKAEPASTNDDADDWRTRALVAEAKLEERERTIEMMNTSLTAMTTALQIANAKNSPAVDAEPSSTAIEVVPARRRWPWRRR
jgi:excisionase family DNA binding protein